MKLCNFTNSAIPLSVNMDHSSSLAPAPAPVPLAVSVPLPPNPQSDASRGDSRHHAPTPPANPESRQKETDLVGQAIVGSSLAFNQLRNVALLAAIPFLAPAAAAAVSILDNVQLARNNKSDFKQLGDDSCNLVSAMMDLCIARKNQGREMPKDLDKDLEALQKTLEQIRAFTQKVAERRGWIGAVKRFLFASIDAGTVQEYRRKLDYSLHLFSLRSDIHARTNLADIAEGQGAIHRELRDNARTNPAAGTSTNPTLGCFSLPFTSSSNVNFSRSVWNNVHGNQSTVYHYNN